MKIQTRLWLGLFASLALASTALGQPVGAPVGAPAGAPAGNLWSYLCMTPEQKFACKTWWCNSAIGQLVSGASGPVGLATGGLVGGRCLQNAIDNAILNKPPEGSESTAARIMKDEAEAKARRMAVRYLGTVDCNYWPDASKALRLSLRADPNECVRFEAALALRNGCCCTNEIIKALEHTVTGSKADGFPSERSDRVRAAAADALSRCPLIETVVPDKIDDKKTDAGPIDPKNYYEKVASMPRGQVVGSARSALTSLQSGGKIPMTTVNVDGSQQTMTPAPIQRRPGTLAGLLTNTFQSTPEHGMPRETEQPKVNTLPAVVTAPQPMPQIQPIAQPAVSQPQMLPPMGPIVPASKATPYSSTVGLKVEIKTPVPASNPNTIRQSTGWVTVETPPATIGAPMPVGAAPMGTRR